MKKANSSPAFQQVLLTVVSFTLLSGAASVWLSTHKDLSPQQTRIFETCNTTWNMGIGAIFGLLGSKATDLFETGEEDE